MKEISVSFLNSKTDPLTTIEEINETSANYLHVDIMDGYFVKNKTMSIFHLKDVIIRSYKPLDIHFMVEEPLEMIQTLVPLEPKYITFHIEATKNPLQIIGYLKKHNIKVGIALSPQTKVDAIKPYLKYIDLVLVMSVIPGEGGQEFMEEVLPKIDQLKELQKEYHFKINVDGGINDKTSKLVDTDIITSGSYICMHDNYEEQINNLR